MAPSGPVFTPTELNALLEYVQLFLLTAKSAQAESDASKTPSDRWAPFDPASVAVTLPPRVANLMARYAWHRAGTPVASDAIAADLVPVLRQAGLKITSVQLHGALMAGAYWINAASNSTSIFGDDAALSALEEFSAFVTGYALSLPPRFAPDEHPDSCNRRFRAYQRRRYGYEASVRSPKALIRRLPLTVQELLESYADQLIYNSPEAAQLVAENLAVALGRPVDPTISAQLDLALATALVWRDLNEFPTGAGVHPILGVRPEGDAAITWNAAAARAGLALKALRAPVPEASNPAKVLSAAKVTVAGMALDAASLNALAVLDDYVSAFAGWIRVGLGTAIAVGDRLSTFDRTYRRTGDGAIATGSSITSELPANAMSVIAHADVLITREKDILPMVEELATALGDKATSPRLRRTLETASAWLHGSVSRLERMRSEDAPAEVVIDLSGPKSLEPFTLARQRDAEALLDLGAAVADLVRFSRTLGADGQTPPGWWIKFHRRSLADHLPTPLRLLERLPEGSERLIKQYAKLLGSEKYSDLISAPRALASTLRRDAEEPCVRTLAIALSVTVVWTDLERISRGRRTDSLLGAEPMTPSDRLLVGRAQAQLEWGLQEILNIDAVPGV